MNKIIIALIEDQLDIQNLIKNIFNPHDYQINAYQDRQELKQEIGIHDVDLFLLAQYSQKENLALIKMLRNKLTLDTPILFLADEYDEDFIIKILHLGADDYITKPFKPGLLHAKASVLLRRKPKLLNKKNILKKDHYMLDKEQKVIKLQDDSIKLSSQEFKLAWFFFTHIDETVSRQTLINTISKGLEDKKSRIIDTCISHIRKKLKLSKNGYCIETVHGFGYRFKKTAKLSIESKLDKTSNHNSSINQDDAHQ